MKYCLFFDENGKIIGSGIDCAPSDGMREVSREEYFNITGDPRAAKEPEPEPEPEANINEQVLALSRVMAVQAAPTMSDKQALTMPDLFPSWEQVLEAGEPLGKDTIVNDGGTLYRVVQDNTTPQAGQPPHGEGMLAVYRPIDVGSTGGADDPIPWLYGMDCYEGKYYSYKGKTYLCKQNMTPCVWAPDTPGLWQWEVQEDT